MHQPDLVWIAALMMESCIETHVISHVSPGHEEQRRRHIERLNLRFDGIHVGVFSTNPDDGNPTKSDKMKEVGATLLFDDNPSVCREVQKAGLHAILIRHPDHELAEPFPYDIPDINRKP